MGKHYILAALCSTIYSIYLTFDSTTFTGFIISAITLSLMIGGFFSFAIYLFVALRKKLGWLAFLPVSIYLLCGIMLSQLFSGSVYLWAITPDHFRTNIFTNKCEFGGGAPHVVHDPWYYREGCDAVSEEEKLDIMRRSNSKYP